MATPDWEAIESAYRAGVMSLRDIGAQYGVSEGAIRKKAKKLEWVRNGGTQVRKSGTQKPSRTLSKPAASGDGESTQKEKPNIPQKRNPNRYAKKSSLITHHSSPETSTHLNTVAMLVVCY
jgi:hypothetical protein